MDSRFDVSQLFYVPTFLDLWPEIESRVEYFGFTDKLTDEEKISEYCYIADQYYKFVSSKQDQIIRHKSYEDMIAEIQAIIDRLEVDRSERKKIIYAHMRQTWLYSILKILENVAEQEG